MNFNETLKEIKEKNTQSLLFEEKSFWYIDFKVVWLIYLWKKWNQEYFVNATFDKKSLWFINKNSLTQFFDLYIENSTIDQFIKWRKSIYNKINNINLETFWFIKNTEESFEFESDDLFKWPINKSTKSFDFFNYSSNILKSIKPSKFKELEKIVKNQTNIRIPFYNIPDKVEIKRNFELLKLKNIEIWENVEIIGTGSFKHNSIEQLSIWNNVSIIKDKAFESNNIKDLVFPEKLNHIGRYSFTENQIEDIYIWENIRYIWPSAFQSNKIKSFTLSDKNIRLKELWRWTLKDNQIEYLYFWNNSSIEWFHQECFENNKIQNLTFPNNLKYIWDSCFKNNKITLIKFNEKLEKIWDESFMNNEIEWTILIKDTIQYLWKWAFKNNKIWCVHLYWNKNLHKSDNAFENNNIEYLNLHGDNIYIPSKMFTNNPIWKIILDEGVRFAIDAFDTVENFKEEYETYWKWIYIFEYNQWKYAWK